MYNKVLADLIKDRLNNELEKIKLELYEDDNYANDIEDSIDVVKKQLVQDSTSDDNVDIEASQNYITESQPIASIVEVVQPIEVPTQKVERMKEESKTFEEVDMSSKQSNYQYASIMENAQQPQELEQKAQNLAISTQIGYDKKKIVGTIVIVTALLVSAYIFLQ